MYWLVPLCRIQKMLTVHGQGPKRKKKKTSKQINKNFIEFNSHYLRLTMPRLGLFSLALHKILDLKVAVSLAVQIRAKFNVCRPLRSSKSIPHVHAWNVYQAQPHKPSIMCFMVLHGLLSLNNIIDLWQILTPIGIQASLQSCHAFLSQKIQWSKKSTPFLTLVNNNLNIVLMINHFISFSLDNFSWKSGKKIKPRYQQYHFSIGSIYINNVCMFVFILPQRAIVK